MSIGRLHRQPKHRLPDSKTSLRSTPGGGVKDLSDAEWRTKLSSTQYTILRDKGTDNAHKGEYDQLYDPGNYLCAGCDSLLYTSEMKFDCGCGWPGFWTNIPLAVREEPDRPGQETAVELMCHACNGHLGHVFRGEGFRNPTNERHCVNSTSVKFEPDTTLRVTKFSSANLKSTVVVAKAPTEVTRATADNAEEDGWEVVDKQTNKGDTSQTMAAQIINSNHVVVFSWVNCPYCKKAKKLLLQEAGYAGDMKVVELDTLGAQGDEIQGEIIKNFNHETVPAIFIGQQIIGGFTDLAAKAKSGELVKLLQPGQVVAKAPATKVTRDFAEKEAATADNEEDGWEVVDKQPNNVEEDGTQEEGENS